ncbi:macrophage erythroblast attacher [Nematocida ausubeli]|uniref:LisH domain-containing protein n=1 Tax=Nematocida ausubeli (strain ATCC PRA-371 / ERTm2) TaxID=1913371 RepID=H8Z8Z9_NEMA1|nr:uncharacterized protein NESG_01014 [Nematocida ausubeli]EHY66430.1 hypothetical protein NERG_00070 [Nematocida ausubeli]KAI5133914.1 macrophage erythroblast attacher [Nematocida ausubeli]KAI5135181.1 macrophage erythroblast attacher [Nematocida ausubeli]KAI5147784.1 macrophage erythroblast attacher [Nematocida ausubeli]KAI5163472.1 macrophage erythroblast attacher [Nematocida ausubeli]
MDEKQVLLQKLLKVTYLSAQKFGNALSETPSDKIHEKISRLLEYLQNKEVECQKIEEEKKIEERIAKEKMNNEMMVELIEFLGKRGFTRTAQSIKNQYPIKSLIDIEPYKAAKDSVKQALSTKYQQKAAYSKNFPAVDTAQKSVRMTVLCREVIRLCELKNPNKKKACMYIKKHKDEIPQQILSLLVLPKTSDLFHSIANRYKDCQISATLMKTLVYKTVPQHNYFYQRVALGISGFITPVCREREKTDCPGCSKSIARIAEYCPKSMRTSSRLLCSAFGTFIPTNNATYVCKKGNVFSECAVKSESQRVDLKKCYFV